MRGAPRWLLPRVQVKMFNHNVFDPAQTPPSTDPHRRQSRRRPNSVASFECLTTAVEVNGVVPNFLGVRVSKGRMRIKATCRNPYDLIKCNTVSGVAGEEELMKKALMGASVAAAIALAPLCIPPAPAHAGDPCVSVTDPAAHQTCIDNFLHGNPMRRYPLGDCEGASPIDGQVGQVCG